MRRIAPLFFFFFFITITILIHYASCELPSTQLTTMNRLNQLLNNTGWRNSSPNPCSWAGVFCTTNHSISSSITKLSLASLSISDHNASWPSLVCQIETLQTLDISNNQLTSIPPPFLTSPCADLKALNLSYNRLAGPMPTFQTPGLQVLDLSHNLLDTMSQFAAGSNLKSLNISHNMITGPIPPTMPTLLQELQLSFNSFEGTITDLITTTTYPNLSLLDVRYNLLTGSIPAAIDQLSNLQQLLVSSNSLTGKIPLSISNITTLKRFSANQNGFTGAIPNGITRYLSYLDLSYNRLDGPIPGDLLSQPNLLTVDLSFNRLEGAIPLAASPSLVRLRLGSNRLTGELPLWIPSSLAYLELDNNSITGIIPPELRLYRNLSLLDLSYNNLAGRVPPELGDLHSLQVVSIQHNNLSGEIPKELGGLQILVKLNISWNALNGSIPSSLSRLKKLVNLDLRANNLIGGIPESMGIMDSLLELQLGKNRLTGDISSLPSKLQIGLNLSNNLFGGPIPSSLSRLQALEILDLSNNKFSGPIPSFLTLMESLTQILLSNNRLTGPVPRFRHNVVLSTDGNEISEMPSNPAASVNRKPVVSIGIVAASIGAVVALAVLVIVALIITVSRRSHKVNGEQSRPLEVIKSNLLTLNVIHRTNLEFGKAMECVGTAAVLKTKFSTYYKAVMTSGMSYLVKKVDWSDKVITQVGLFEQELESVGRLRNSSVMIPLGYALTRDSAYLLYESCEKGSLFDALHGNGNGLDWTNRYSIALGIANGLAFLHGCPIILLDLSSKVVMLKSLNEPLIGDIELSKVIDPSKCTGNLSAVAGSVGYVPPEYAYTMRVTTAGNVYSFGVILLELLTGKTAVSEGSELAKWVHNKHHNFDQILDPTITTAAIKYQMLAILKVALACISVSPEARPKMSSVLHMLLNARN